ncbi:uncharacterized protein LOC125230846 [Leguminivora glycinivorella]|uniref:uncharacterized protein LOC125230846 n=1 Tax=Leguminivora glycinivorella TaxID=1035111 RepID=UPI00200C4B89|nr:uncharacterized protein LOC125230846 [Leguminivora glycinivorella]
MFESDDFDQILSQFNFPDDPIKETENIGSKGDSEKSIPVKPTSPVNVVSQPLKFANIASPSAQQKTAQKIIREVEACSTEAIRNSVNSENISPKHTKRKMINSYFDHNAKRKFPGPAGLLNSNFEESKDETICHMELFSQDVDLSDNYFGEKFETEIWRRLSEDIQKSNLGAIDSIKSVKQQALAGHLRRRKAQVVMAFVETVDRSATDPLITLRDTTGCIKCTLHRDAWSTFAPYIVSEYCAVVLRRPTVLTTGSAFKKHYLNITLSNIHAIYSSAVLSEETDKPLPDGYDLECDNDMTVIRTVPSTNADKDPFCNETSNDTSDLLDDLDNIFTDDLF